MKRTQKETVVGEVREAMAGAKIGIVSHYRGLTVGEMNTLRRALRQENTHVRVVKNTLAKRAAKGTDFEPMGKWLTGPTVIALSKDPVGPAKVLTAFAKKQPKLEILGGVLEGKPVDLKGIQSLAELPPKEVLLGKLLGTLQAPVSGFVNVLAALPGGLVRCLDQIRQQKEANG